MILINSYYYIINVLFGSSSVQTAHVSIFLIDLGAISQYYEDSQGSVINIP